MKKVILVIIILAFPLFTESMEYAVGSKILEVYKERNLLKEIKTDSISNILKTEFFLLKDYKRIDTLIYPVIMKNVEEYYKDTFPYSVSKREYALIVETIATSEGSALSKKGIMPFKSSLFVKGNNPFGIQGKGMKVHTFEYINGVKTPKYLPFRRFSSLDDAILELFKLFDRKRYNYLKKCETGKDFFYGMKRCGYFTSPTHHKRFFIPHFNKLNTHKK